MGRETYSPKPSPSAPPIRGSPVDSGMDPNPLRASTMPLPKIDPGSKWAGRYVDVLNIPLVKRGVLIVYLIATAVCVNWAIALFDRTDLKWNPPPSSDAYDTQEAVEEFFPKQIGNTEFLVIIEWDDKNLAKDIREFTSEVIEPAYSYNGSEYNMTGPDTFTFALRDKIWHEWCNVPVAFTHALANQPIPQRPNCTAFTNNGEYITAVEGYYTLSTFWAGSQEHAGAGDILLAPPSTGNRSTSITVTFQGTNLGLENKQKEFNSWLNRELKGLQATFLQPNGMTAGVFSISGGVSEILDTVIADLALADGIAIPLSLLIVMIALRNLRLMIWPILTIITTTIMSMAIVAEIADHVLTNVIATPVMISLVVGLPVGHSLFMLNRFREALLEGEDCPNAVKRMLTTAGKTIILSQVAFALCCLIIVIIKVENVQGLGLAMFICVVTALVTSMLMGPALLLTFPTYFEAANIRTNIFALGKNKRNTVALASQLKGRSSQYDGRASVVPDYTPQLEGTLWARFATVTQVSTIQNYIIVAAIIIFIIPFAIILFMHMDVNDSFSIYFPRDDSFTKSAQRAFKNFGAGLPATYKIAMLPNTDDMQYLVRLASIGPSDLWDQVAVDFMGNVSQLQDYSPRGIIGAYNSGGERFSGNTTASCLMTVQAGEAHYAFPNCVWVAASYFSYTASIVVDNVFFYSKASIITIKLDVDPLSPEGRKFYNGLKDVIKMTNDANAGKNASLYPKIAVTGTPMNSWEAIDRVEDAWSWVAAAFIAVGFTVIFIGTHSLMVAFRAVFTTFLTICFSLGFAVLTYCYGALEWTGSNALHRFDPLEDGDGSIHYAVLIITVPMIIGFSISHELFLVSATQEWYHYHRLETSESIKMALIGTGWMNILSGVIVAVSFMGHMFSRLPILNQIAFIMFWALLFDVLVIRTVLVPTLMAPWGKYNWWPSMDRRDAYEALGETMIEREVESTRMIFFFFFFLHLTSIVRTKMLAAHVNLL